MVNWHRRHGRIGRVADKTGLVGGLVGKARMFRPAGQCRRLPANRGQEDEDTNHNRDYGYKDQIFPLHIWLVG